MPHDKTIILVRSFTDDLANPFSGRALIRFGCFAMCAILSACSLPMPLGGRYRGSEILLGYVASDQAQKSYQRIVVGLDVRGGRVWPGVDLGISNLRVFYPVPQGLEEAPPASGSRPYFTPPLGVGWGSSSGIRHAVGWILFAPIVFSEKCSFVHHSYAGIGSLWSPWKSGLHAGWGSLTLLHADPKATAAYVLEYSSRDFAHSRFQQIIGGTVQ